MRERTNSGDMGKDNWIYAYYQKVKDNSIVVSRWVSLLLAYLIAGIEKKEFFYDNKKANAAIDWIESHCFHVEGPLAPGNLKLELWQKALIASIFGIVDKNGYRQFREVLLVVARKNGKSLLAAAIERYIWLVDGGFGAKVYNVAPKLDQANIIYNSIWMMTTLDPAYQKLKDDLSERDAHNKKVKDDSELPRLRQSDLFVPATNSTVKKVAFNYKSSDGYNPSAVIADEVAAWAGDAGLKTYEVFKSGMGARPEPLLLSCTTSGYVNDSIYDELVKRATRFLLGDSKEKRLLPFLYMIDDIEKWNDINELRKSNPNLGVSVTVDYLLEEIAVAEGSLSKKSEFITKYNCLKQNSSLAWLPAQVVQTASGDPLKLEDFRECYCVGGIDLSQTRDLTACNVIIEKNGELNVFSHFFLPAERLEEAEQRDGVPYRIFVQRGFLTLSGENFVDYHDCFDWFRKLVEEYEIYPLQIGYDRYSAQYLIQDLEGYGFHCDDVYQGDNLWGVIQETQGLLEDKKIRIGDNDLLKSHLLNSAVKMSVERGRGKLVKLNPKLHIDGTAALLDAMTVRQKYYAEIGEQLKNEG